MQKTLNIVVSERIKIPSAPLPPMLKKKLTERLVFINPEYEFRQSRGEWLGSIPAQIHCLYEQRRHYFIPRGFLYQLLDLCESFNLKYRLIDRQRELEPVEFQFHGVLKDYQELAYEEMTTRDLGTLVGGAKSGKTVIALYLIAQRQQPTMIIVPNVALLGHWKEKLVRFLKVSPKEVGIIGEGKFEVGPRVSVAHVSALYRRAREVRDKVGFLVVDECHRTPSRTFNQVVSNFDCRFLLGLSSTNQRRDRLSRLIYYYVGDILHQIDARKATEIRAIFQADVVVRETDFEYPYENSDDYPAMLEALARDPERNQLIAHDVSREMSEGAGPPLLVLTQDEVQDNTLKDMLDKEGLSSLSLDPELVAKGEKGLEKQLKSKKIQVVLANRQFFQKMIPETKFEALFLTTPLNFRGRTIGWFQGMLRRDDGQPLIKVYDYVDSKISILDNFFRMRSYAYGLRLPRPAPPK
ncbi:MAG: DEAD/DEAH box helicase family protein [Deltaproteobacteria bacterium]|nr:DEAD/DEAH box helicase family protein [Deltaproteobacteria bacterium]